MKFLVIVLVIRFLIEVLTKRKNTGDQKNAELMNGNIFHPAEFDLR